MKSAGKARNNGLYRHIRTSKEIIRNLLNDYIKFSPKEKFNFRFSVMYFFYKFIDLPQRFCYNEGNAGKEARFA